jgi:hypothetical protein
MINLNERIKILSVKALKTMYLQVYILYNFKYRIDTFYNEIKHKIKLRYILYKNPKLKEYQKLSGIKNESNK